MTESLYKLLLHTSHVGVTRVHYDSCQENRSLKSIFFSHSLVSPILSHSLSPLSYSLPLSLSLLTLPCMASSLSGCRNQNDEDQWENVRWQYCVNIFCVRNGLEGWGNLMLACSLVDGFLIFQIIFCIQHALQQVDLHQ